MSTGVGAILKIGGSIPTHTVAALCEAITEQGVSLDWGDSWFEPTTTEELLDALDEGAALRLLDENSRGSFDDVEAILIEYGIPFDRLVDGDSEGPGSVTKFRPGMAEPRWFTGDCSGNIYLDGDDARAILTSLEHDAVNQAIEDLRYQLGLDIPALPPFTILAEDGTPLTLPSDDQTEAEQETT